MRTNLVRRFQICHTPLCRKDQKFLLTDVTYLWLFKHANLTRCSFLKYEQLLGKYFPQNFVVDINQALLSAQETHL